MSSQPPGDDRPIYRPPSGPAQYWGPDGGPASPPGSGAPPGPWLPASAPLQPGRRPVLVDPMPTDPAAYQQMLRGPRYRWWKPLLSLVLVLLLARNRRFLSVPRGLWLLMGLLTLTNTALSVLWR